MSFNKKSRPSINMFSDLFDKYDLSLSLFLLSLSFSLYFFFLSLFAIWTIILFPFFLFSVLECIHGRQSLEFLLRLRILGIKIRITPL